MSRDVTFVKSCLAIFIRITFVFCQERLLYFFLFGYMFKNIHFPQKKVFPWPFSSVSIHLKNHLMLTSKLFSHIESFFSKCRCFHEHIFSLRFLDFCTIVGVMETQWLCQHAVLKNFEFHVFFCISFEVVQSLHDKLLDLVGKIQ